MLKLQTGLEFEHELDLRLKKFYKHRPWTMLMKLLVSEIKFMLKLQIGQILTKSKSDLSGVWACFLAT